MDGVKGSDYDPVLSTKGIVVSSPEQCPLNSECQCKLYGEIEGETANKCPEGSYGSYEFPYNCPLLENNYIIKVPYGINIQEKPTYPTVAGGGETPLSELTEQFNRNLTKFFYDRPGPTFGSK